MTRDEAPPPDVAAMLAVERSIPMPPAGAFERVRARLHGHVAAGGGAATPAASGLIGKPFLVTVLVIVAGGSLAAYLARDRGDGEPPANRGAAVEPDDKPSPRPDDVAPPIRPEPASPAPVAAPEPRPPRDVTPALGGRPKGDPTPVNERELLERALRCVAQRDAICALAAISSHVKRFRTGALVEERDRLWIQALQLAGDTTAAEQHARQFLATYPRSVYVTAVRQVLAP